MINRAVRENLPDSEKGQAPVGNPFELVCSSELFATGSTERQTAVKIWINMKGWSRYETWRGNSQTSGKTIYRDGDRAIKVFDEMYAKSDILNEALNQARVEETGLAVPRILEVTKLDGKWAIVSDFIEGETLASLLEKHPEKLNDYMDLFVALQMEVHSKHAPLLTKLKDKMNRKISESTLDATTRYELHTRLEGMPKHKKVCHGDFNPGNIIITPEGKAYLLDWSHATQGNASADVARTYLLFCLEGKEDIAELYLKLFCQKSDTAKQYVQSWLPIVAASQSVKGKPEERNSFCTGLMLWIMNKTIMLDGKAV